MPAGDEVRTRGEKFVEADEALDDAGRVQEHDMAERLQIRSDSKKHAESIQSIEGPSQAVLGHDRDVLSRSDLTVGEHKVVPASVRQKMGSRALVEPRPELDIFTGANIKDGNLQVGTLMATIA